MHAYSSWAILACSLVAWAGPPLRSPLADDAMVQRWVQQTTANHPARTRATAQATRAQTQISPASALPDPEVAIGFQRLPSMEVMLENRTPPTI